MRYDKTFAVFAKHSDWYVKTPGVGYVPTDKAPEEARRAMAEYNSYTFKKKNNTIIN